MVRNMGIKLIDTKDFKNIRTVHLLLGPECDMHCRHCQQMNEKETKILTRRPTEDVMKFLDNFIEFSMKRQSAAEVWENSYKIMFYGGEALLHLSLIREIVEYFYKKHDFLKDGSFRFSLTTNGLGITEEFVEFANKYEILVNFSYDAPHPWAVRDYVSDTICDLVNKIKFVKILSYGCAYNYDPLLVYRCQKEKFPNALLTYHMELFRTFKEMPNDIDTYDWDKVRLAVRRLCIATKMGDTFAIFTIRNMLNVKLYPETNVFHNSGGIGVCVAGDKLISVTLDGKIVFCYNCYDELGTLRDDTIDSIYEKACTIWYGLYDKECSDCSVRDVCYWGCARMLRDEHNHAVNCERFRKPFFTILKEEVQSLSEPLTEEEKIWFAGQELDMEEKVKSFLGEGKRFESGDA